MPLGSRISNAFVSYGKYVVKMFWPQDLCGLYLRHGDWPAGLVALAAVFLVTMCVAAVVLVKRKPYFTFGWFYYFGTLVPVIGIVQVGMQAMADRFTYIPMTGLFIIVVWGGWEIARKYSIPKPALALVVGAACVACAVVTVHILPYWTDSETFFKRMIAVDDKNYMARYNLGNQYSRKGDKQRATEQFQAAIKAEPNYAEAHNNLAGVYQDQRRFDDAIAEYKEAARIHTVPTYVLNVGNAYVNAQRYAEAIPVYEGPETRPQLGRGPDERGVGAGRMGQSVGELESGDGSRDALSRGIGLEPELSGCSGWTRTEFGARREIAGSRRTVCRSESDAR